MTSESTRCLCKLFSGQDTDKLIAHRFEVHRTTEVSYVPDSIDLVKRESKTVRTPEMGALFHNNYDKLPTQMASVLWEHTMQPGQCLQPCRPKVYLMCALTLKPGVAVRLS